MALYQVKGKLDLSCFSSSPNQWKISESCPGSKPEGERKKERQKKTKPFLVSATGPREAMMILNIIYMGWGCRVQRLPIPELVPWQFALEVPIDAWQEQTQSLSIPTNNFSRIISSKPSYITIHIRKQDYTSKNETTDRRNRLNNSICLYSQFSRGGHA